MNSKIGISIGCTNSCGIRKGRDSSALKVVFGYLGMMSVKTDFVTVG